MKISVIVPIFNVEQWLLECLNSAIAAARRNRQGSTEIICIDDGSTDRSCLILEKLEKILVSKEEKNEEISFVVCRQTNAGVSSARNAALKIATGDWIVFLDGDDIISPYALQSICSAVEKYPMADMVAFDAVVFSERVDVKWNRPDEISFSAKSIKDALCYNDIWRGMWNYCYKKTIVPTEGFAPFAIGEDLLYMNKSLCKAAFIVELHAVLYGYRQRIGSAMNSPATLKKCTDHLWQTVGRIMTFSNSAKKIDKRVFRRLGLELMETSVDTICKLPRADRKLAWIEYWKAIHWRRGYSNLPLCTRIQMQGLDFLKSNILAVVLCRGLYLLRRLGFKMRTALKHR